MTKYIKFFLRLAVSPAMLSAVADRFGLAMFTSVGLKATFDYSVWNAVGACLAISCLKEKYWEIDSVFLQKNLTLPCIQH